MALVKRPGKLKPTQPKDQTAGRRNAAAARPSKPPSVHLTTAMIFAAMAKPNATSAKPSPPSQQEQQLVDAVPTSLTTNARPSPARKAKQRGSEAANSTRKKRRTATREPVDLNRPGYLRLVDVLTVFPVSRAKWYAGVASGIYPQSYPLGVRARGYRTADIKELVERTGATTVAAD